MAQDRAQGREEVPTWIPSQAVQRELRDDLAWLIEKAKLALDLDAFCTTQADRDRLDRIARRLV